MIDCYPAGVSNKHCLLPLFSFLIESSFLQVTRITIKSGLSSKLSLIGPCTAELAALERLKNSP